ncbi:MAG TPA: hypothetical protein VFA07_16095 [Chthonomonadaceae bacterium]|nr:hypothetical protein [Chthonomonadaceae bacterium]
MILTLNLTIEEERRIQEARRKGIDVDAMIRRVIAGLPAAEAHSREDKTLELFAQWQKEAETLTPEQAAEEDAGWDEIMQNVQKERLHLTIPDLSDHE